MTQFPSTAPIFSPIGLDGIARLSKVFDGDTLSVISTLHPQDKPWLFNIRQASIDTAEMKDKNETVAAYARKARRRVLELAGATEDTDLSVEEILVHVEIIKLDKYGGRFIGHVKQKSSSEKTFAQILLDEKLAKPYDGKTKDPWTEQDVKNFC